jgi:hypothetical protein
LSVVGIQSAPESDNIWSPETCRRLNQATEIMPVPEPGGRNPDRQTKFRPGSGRIRQLIHPDLAKTARIRPNLDGSGH